MKRHKWKVFVVFLALLGLAGVLIVTFRDLPRRRVQAMLSERLDADVRVGSLSVRGAREFRLSDVSVRRIASEPRLGVLTVDTIDAFGSIREILSFRFERLALSGITARLVPPDPRIEAVPYPQTAGLEVKSLQVRDLVVVIATEGSETRISGEATIRDLGTAPEGEVVLRAGEISLAPLFALFGPQAPTDEARWPETSLAQTDLELVLSEKGQRLELNLRTDHVDVAYGERGLRFEPFSLNGVATVRDDGNPIRFRLSPDLPEVDWLVLTGELDRESLAVIGFRGELKGGNPEPWLALLPRLPAETELQGTVDLEVEGIPGEPVDVLLDTEISRLRFPFRNGLLASEGIALEWAGRADLTGVAPEGPLEVRLAVPRVDGSIDGFVIPETFFPMVATLTGNVEGADPARMKGRLEIEAGEAGSISVDGLVEYAAPKVNTSVSWTWGGAGLGDLEALLEAGGVKLHDTVRMDGTIRAWGTASGDPTAPTIEGTIEVRGTGAGSLPAAWFESKGEGEWEYRDADLKVEFELLGREHSLRLASIESEGSPHLDPLESIQACFQGSVSIDLATGVTRVHSLGGNLGDLGRVNVEGSWLPGASGRIDGTIRLDDLAISRLREFLVPISGDWIPGYALGGDASAELTASMDGSGRWTSEGRAWLRNGGFSSADGSRVAEGLGGEWDLRLAGGGGAGTVSARVSSRLRGSPILWGGFFADYSDLQAGAELSLDLAPESGAWKGHATLRISEGPEVEASLDAVPEAPLAYSLEISVSDVQPAVDRYLRLPLQGSVAGIEGLQASGRAQIELRGSLGDTLRSARGRLKLEGVELGGPGGEIRLDDLDLELPVDLVWQREAPEAPAVVSGEPGSGSLRFGRLVAGGFEIPETATSLRVQGDTIRLDRSLEIPLLGGVVDLEALTVAELLRPSRHLESAVRLERVSLRELTDAFGFLPLEGTIEGNFPKIRLSREIFRMEGDGEFALLGGTLRVSDIRGRNLLSAYPRLTFSTRFEDIDLRRLTSALDFGEMTGLLRGEFRDFQLALGVPVRFQGKIDTVSRKGVPRRINVKAVNNIAILGTGGNVGVLDRRIQRFFKHYTYEKLGIEMKLESDRFLLRGLERRGEKELFLKGRFPFPIDVVNAQPGQTVSFRTMLDRVRSLDFAGVTTGGPPSVPPRPRKR